METLLFNKEAYVLKVNQNYYVSRLCNKKKTKLIANVSIKLIFCPIICRNVNVSSFRQKIVK